MFQLINIKLKLTLVFIITTLIFGCSDDASDDPVVSLVPISIGFENPQERFLENAKQLSIEISLSGTTADRDTFSLLFEPYELHAIGPAIYGEDYTFNSDLIDNQISIAIPPAQSSTFSIPFEVNDDNKMETNEMFKLTLRSKDENLLVSEDSVLIVEIVTDDYLIGSSANEVLVAVNSTNGAIFQLSTLDGSIPGNTITHLPFVDDFFFTDIRSVTYDPSTELIFIGRSSDDDIYSVDLGFGFLENEVNTLSRNDNSEITWEEIGGLSLYNQNLVASSSLSSTTETHALITFDVNDGNVVEVLEIGEIVTEGSGITIDEIAGIIYRGMNGVLQIIDIENDQIINELSYQTQDISEFTRLGQDFEIENSILTDITTNIDRESFGFLRTNNGEFEFLYLVKIDLSTATIEYRDFIGSFSLEEDLKLYGLSFVPISAFSPKN